MKKKITVIVLFILATIVSYYYGLVSHKYHLPPFPQIMALKYHLFPESIGYSDVSARNQVPCTAISGRGVMVALAFGQSNSGNHGETLYRPQMPVYNFYRGLCYLAQDPLPGATGDRGSVWTRLGDLLVRQGLYEKVVFITIGVGSTVIEQWTKGGYLHPRIVHAVKETRAKGLKITHLFWVQGGSEKRTKGDPDNKKNYKKNFLTMLASIRNMGVEAPIYVAVSTYNGIDSNSDIQEVQRELADPENKIFAGPNDDQLYRDRANHWEEVHLSGQGLERCAGAWLAAIRKAEKK
jgi:hypothetical protein